MVDPAAKPEAERWLERGLFASRWLMAPFYLGLVIALGVLLVVFVGELVRNVPIVIQRGRGDDAVVMTLSLIDLSLGANLTLIVILSGYENFVSRIDVGANLYRPAWMGALDFSGMKMKLVASIVVISVVVLLRMFMALAEPGSTPDPFKLAWMIGLHMTFVVSGVLLALIDRLDHQADERAAVDLDPHGQRE
jgi:uncharacterized protein (TIGR00645 family)